MAQPPALPVEDKLRIVLSILAGETTVAAAARKAKVSEVSVGRWKQQFIEAGRAGLIPGGTPGPNARERELQARVDELTTALGEAHVELQVWKKAADRLPPFRTSR